MSLGEWLSAFRELHEKARRKQLSHSELLIYRTGRDELARALLAAQRLTLKPGETPRRTLRVARALQVDIEVLTSSIRAISVDISIGGFSCLLSKTLPLGEEVGVSMRIPASEPIVCRCRVADVKPQSGNVRAAFQFASLSDEDRERLEMFVFDTVLAQMAG